MLVTYTLANLRNFLFLLPLGLIWLLEILHEWWIRPFMYNLAIPTILSWQVGSSQFNWNSLQRCFDFAHNDSNTPYMYMWVTDINAALKASSNFSAKEWDFRISAVAVTVGTAIWATICIWFFPLLFLHTCHVVCNIWGWWIQIYSHIQARCAAGKLQLFLCCDLLYMDCLSSLHTLIGG